MRGVGAARVAVAPGASHPALTTPSRTPQQVATWDTATGVVEGMVESSLTGDKPVCVESVAAGPQPKKTNKKGLWNPRGVAPLSSCDNFELWYKDVPDSGFFVGKDYTGADKNIEAKQVEGQLTFKADASGLLEGTWDRWEFFPLTGKGLDDRLKNTFMEASWVNQPAMPQSWSYMKGKQCNRTIPSQTPSDYCLLSGVKILEYDKRCVACATDNNYLFTSEIKIQFLFLVTNPPHKYQFVGDDDVWWAPRPRARAAALLASSPPSKSISPSALLSALPPFLHPCNGPPPFPSRSNPALAHP